MRYGNFSFYRDESDLRISRPETTSPVIKEYFCTGWSVVELTIRKDRSPHYECANRPSGQRRSMPGAPAALRLLILVADFS